MHLCYYVRRHTLDDKDAVGEIYLAFATDRKRCWGAQRSAAALS